MTPCEPSQVSPGETMDDGFGGEGDENAAKIGATHGEGAREPRTIVVVGWSRD